MFSRTSICVIALSAVVCCPTASYATEWFVAPGGAGSGSQTSPLGRIQDAINAAQPGDIITVASGTYREAIATARSGKSGAAIILRAAGARGSVVLTAAGRVATINHGYFSIYNLVLDGQYGANDTVRVSSSGHFFRLWSSEVRRSSRDLIDIGAAQGVIIERSIIHHALNATNGRTDAHGIVAGAVRNLIIRDTDIHTFSGDGVQVDPGRAAPGWQNVIIQRCRIWLQPLAAAENGFAAGIVPGENAVDTKASAALPRSTIVIRDTTAWGFRGGLIGNMAAFNLKENIDATVDRVTVHSSEIAFRLRGAATGGAWVRASNAVVYNVTTAFRYEDNITNLRIWNNTVGRGVSRAFQAASSNSGGLDVRNVLILGSLPSEASHWSNRSVGAEEFVNAASHDYRLVGTASAVDAGVTISTLTTDRLRTRRPQGAAYDVGAYEWR